MPDLVKALQEATGGAGIMRTEAPASNCGQIEAGSRRRNLVVSLLRHTIRNPRHVMTLLRGEYRRHVGIRMDRKLHPGTSGLPVNISINLTRRCNLKCGMCIQHRHASPASPGLTWFDPERELPVSAWVRLMDRATAFRPALYVTGGEPMLYPGFEEFIKEAGRRHLFVQLATNGTLLSGNAGMLVEEGVGIVIVSMDGPARVHDEVRGRPGLFRRTSDGVRSLLSARARRRSPTPVVGINFTISKTNVECIQDMVPIALDLGVDFLQFQHTIFSSAAHAARHNRVFARKTAGLGEIELVHPSIPEGEYYESDIVEEDVGRIAEGLQRARKSARGRLRLSFLPDLSTGMLEPYYLNLNHPFPGKCDTLWKTLRIMPDGTVSPCLHVVAGNVARQSIDEVWNGPCMQRFRELIAGRLFPGCARCCNRSFS